MAEEGHRRQAVEDVVLAQTRSACYLVAVERSLISLPSRVGKWPVCLQSLQLGQVGNENGDASRGEEGRKISWTLWEDVRTKMSG